MIVDGRMLTRGLPSHILYVDGSVGYEVMTPVTAAWATDIDVTTGHELPAICELYQARLELLHAATCDQHLVAAGTASGRGQSIDEGKTSRGKDALEEDVAKEKEALPDADVPVDRMLGGGLVVTLTSRGPIGNDRSFKWLEL